MNSIVEYVAGRTKEPSTWAGVAFIFGDCLALGLAAVLGFSTAEGAPFSLASEAALQRTSRLLPLTSDSPCLCRSLDATLILQPTSGLGTDA